MIKKFLKENLKIRLNIEEESSHDQLFTYSYLKVQLVLNEFEDCPEFDEIIDEQKIEIRRY